MCLDGGVPTIFVLIHTGLEEENVNRCDPNKSRTVEFLYERLIISPNYRCLDENSISDFASGIYFAGLLLPTLGGFDLIIEHDLVENYSVWAIDIKEQACIVKKDQPDSDGASCVVPPMVFEYGWSKNFIIAKQLPESGGAFDINRINWYIIEVENGKVHGPLDEDEFYTLRKALDIPDDLFFTEEIEP